MSDLVVDPFGGPGGWAEGLALLGRREIGIEYDPSACATRAAAGHRTIRADVRRMPLDHLAGRVEGLIASPPCQAFSSAGKGDGRAELNRLRKAIDEGRWSAPVPGGEVLEVGRWAETLRPRWVACEQVPPVLPLWRAYADRWRALYGWSCWAGLLCAADYGVPQTRTRAFLLARTDGRPALPPAATHCKGGADTLFGGLAPWVSMADALGWTGQDDPARTLCGDRSPRWMYPDPDGSHGRVVVRTGANSMVTGRTGSRAGDGDVQPYERSIDRPAPVVDTKAGVWTLHTNRDQRPDGTRQTITDDRPAPALTAKAGGQWAFDRPATTIAGDARCWPPGHKINADDVARLGADEAAERYGDRAGTDAVKLTVTEALVLQSFRPDYPVQGTKTKQFEQVGNAVPPVLAAAVLAGLV